jgi:hypothetical protein
MSGTQTWVHTEYATCRFTYVFTVIQSFSDRQILKLHLEGDLSAAFGDIPLPLVLHVSYSSCHETLLNEPSLQTRLTSEKM